MFSLKEQKQERTFKNKISDKKNLQSIRRAQQIT